MGRTEGLSYPSCVSFRLNCPTLTACRVIEPTDAPAGHGAVSAIIGPQHCWAAPLLESSSSIHRLRALRPPAHPRQITLLRSHLRKLQRSPETPCRRFARIQPPVQFSAYRVQQGVRLPALALWPSRRSPPASPLPVQLRDRPRHSRITRSGNSGPPKLVRPPPARFGNRSDSRHLRAFPAMDV